MRRLWLLVTIFTLMCAPLRAQIDEEEEVTEAMYVSMHPHFLTNLAESRRFVQMKAQTLVSNPDTEAALKLHMPAIRHGILMRISLLTSEELRNAETKQLFLSDSLAIMKKTLEDHGAAADVEGFFITHLIVQ